MIILKKSFKINIAILKYFAYYKTFCKIFFFSSQIKASHSKSFVHGHPPASQKYFLIYHTNFVYCLQTKEKNKNKKKHQTVINVYFFVVDYLESWLNLMIASMFLLESRQVEDIQNREP